MCHRMGVRQRWAWTAAATVSVICACCCGFGWQWVLLGGLAAAAVQWFLDRELRSCGLAVLYRTLGVFGKIAAILSLLWFTAAAAWSANLADRAFPAVDGFPALGLTLLALAAWGSEKGSAACARCAGVLLLFLGPMTAAVAVSALPMAQPRYLLPWGDGEQGLAVLGLFLLPAGVWYLPCRRRKSGGSGLYLLLPVAGAALAAVTSAVLSPVLAGEMASPFYTVARSVTVFGVAERVEPLLSAAMTMGAFCLVSASACACRQLSGRPWGGAAACGAAAVLMGPARSMGAPVLAVGGGIFGILLPVLVVLMTKHREKTA